MHSDMMVAKPSEMKGKWTECFNEKRPLYLEIGCGKGNFILGMAQMYPDRSFLAVEGDQSVAVTAVEKIKDVNVHNVIFISCYVNDITDWFAEGEIKGIYLNFSDPWPKTQYAKRRLTYNVKLKQYFRIMNKGFIEFKTDNDGLFNYSLTQFKTCSLKIAEISRDLHKSEYVKNNVMTEYEQKFSGKGKNINYAKVYEGEITDMGKMAALNGRTIPKEDKIFGISSSAKKMIQEKGKENVINATIGALLDDNADLIVLSSVDEAVKSLKPQEYAEYSPIAGTAGFRDAIKKAAFGKFVSSSYCEAVATPGGTGAIRNAVDNYSCMGDKILTADWHWTPYKTIADEIGRGLETFKMFDDEGYFNIEDFKYKVRKLLKNQEHLVIILNTPANNPTGYSLSEEDWGKVTAVLNDVDMDKKVALVVDVAYIDFAGDEEETRKFLPFMEKMNENVLPIIAYSTSKTFTFYGFRCAAMICMAKTEEIAEEFVKVNTFASRGTWSNSPRGPQTVIEKIYADNELLARVDSERKEMREMLMRRGRAFEEKAAEVGLPVVPFRAGFFISIPCDNPDLVCAKLAKKSAFVVPMNKGVRVSVASISEEKCRLLPALIKEVL